MVDRVKIVRKHTATSGEPLYYRSRNVNWMRVYVPQGSELLEASGFERPSEKFFEEPGKDWNIHSRLQEQYRNTDYHRESGTRIYPEQEKTVFANWTILDPGETNVIYFKYKLPFKLQDKDQNKEPQPWWRKWGERIVSPQEQSKKVAYSLMVQKQAGSEADTINSFLKKPSKWRSVWKYPDRLKVSEKGWNVSEKLDRDKYWAAVLEKE